MHAMLLLVVLATTLAAAAAKALSASPDEAAGSLQSNLAAGGLEQPQVLSGILRELGLPSVQDVRLLNLPEQLELSKSLREQGVNLGSRSKLRRLSEEAIASGDEPAEGTSREKSGTKHRKTPPGSGRSERDLHKGAQSEQRRQLQSRGGGFSIEVAAIAFTGLIGMVGYAVQARSAQKASKAQASLELEAAERDKAEAKAAKQLERVQLQMAEWVRPITMENQTVNFGWFNMAKVCRPRERAVSVSLRDSVDLGWCVITPLTTFFPLFRSWGLWAT